jgi:hypothetical protein
MHIERGASARVDGTTGGAGFTGRFGTACAISLADVGFFGKRGSPIPLAGRVGIAEIAADPSKGKSRLAEVFFTAPHK